MKKFIVGLVAMVVLLTISSYVESSYCHSLNRLNTVPPYEYNKSAFCVANSFPALIGLLIYDAVQ